jgi:hypothetical protein
MTPRQIYERLEAVIDLNSPPRPILELLEEQLTSYFGLPGIRAAEEAERLQKAIRKLIEQNRAEAEAAGSMPTIVISGDNDRAICGSCWIESYDGEDVRAAKQRRLHVDPVYRAIQGLSFNDFERFGACILRELGASSVHVTPHSNDQGIDFYGVLSLADLGTVPAPFSQLARDVTLRFAGQAKHYPRAALGPAVIRELVGSLLLARHGVHTSTLDPFENLHLLALHPLIGLVFTTGRFTSGALKIASEVGLIARSGEQLSVFLADRGVGYIAGAFVEAEFRRWLTS